MADWLIPNVHESRWQDRPRTRRGDGQVIGVFCDGRPMRDAVERSHANDLWLVGSLTATDVTGERSWLWAATYPTGDGYSIYLNYGQPEDDAAAGVSHPLEGDRLLRTRAEFGRADQSTIRANYRMSCKICRQHYTWHSDKIQAIAGRLFDAGRREISRVDLRVVLAA